MNDGSSVARGEGTYSSRSRGPRRTRPRPHGLPSTWPPARASLAAPEHQENLRGPGPGRRPGSDRLDLGHLPAAALLDEAEECDLNSCPLVAREERLRRGLEGHRVAGLGPPLDGLLDVPWDLVHLLVCRLSVSFLLLLRGS